MPEGFYTATITQLLYAQTIQNVLHFTGPDGGAEQLPQLAANVDSVWVEKVKGIQSQALRYIQIKTAFSQEGGPSPFTLTINKPGTSSDSADLDTTKAIIWRLRTQHAGRHGHGRVYIGGVHHNNFEFGLITSNVVNALQPLGEQILDLFGAGAFTLCVGNKSGPLTYFPVTSFEPSPTAGHINKRTVGRGI